MRSIKLNDLAILEHCHVNTVDVLVVLYGGRKISVYRTHQCRKEDGTQAGMTGMTHF